MAQGHSVDEYLETIYFLAFPIGEYRPAETELPTLASRVACRPHVRADREPGARAAFRARAGLGGHDRAARRARRRASALVLRRGARPRRGDRAEGRRAGGGAVPRAARRGREGDWREG